MAEARDGINPSILCLLSNWLSAPLQPFSCPALSNGLMSAKQSHYTLNDHVFKVALKNLGDYEVTIICINKKGTVCARLFSEWVTKVRSFKQHVCV